MSEPAVTANQETAQERIFSIDVLRGFDMLWILGAADCVSALAKAFPNPVLAFLDVQMEHVDWEGFRFYDLIFPLFVFLMGMSMTYSLDKRLATQGRMQVYKHIVARSVLLFIAGLIYYGGMKKILTQDIMWGVLSRMGVCYLFAGFLYVWCRPRTLIAVSVAILLGYWALFTFVPVPGTGMTGCSESVNWCRYIDEHIPPCYEFSTEDLLSHLPAIVSCLLGVLAALFLRRTDYPPERKVMLFLGAGVVMAATGYLWGMQFWVVKKLWTSSYVLVAGGYSCILFGIFYWITDVRRWRAWTPFCIWVGMNPIALYLSEPFIQYRRAADSLVGGPVATLFGAYAPLLTQCTELALVLTLAHFLFKRKIFLRL